MLSDKKKVDDLLQTYDAGKQIVMTCQSLRNFSVSVWP